MKYFILFGGFVGFVLTLASGILAGTEFASALCDASIGCFVGGLLMRGFRASVTHCARVVLNEKAQQHQAATAQPA